MAFVRPMAAFRAGASIAPAEAPASAGATPDVAFATCRAVKDPGQETQ